MLIHPFVVGTSFGVCACDPTAPTGREVVLVEPSSEAPAAPTARARAEIERGARLAAAAHGPSELEWVSDGDRVLFLQLRAYRAPGARATAPGVDWSEAAGWTWDAAHNPSALSPAQAGLVQLVDARCHIGLQQRVLGGYLFFRPDAAAPAPTPDNASDPRALFERVRTAVEGQLQGLPPDASLATVLEVYVAGYQGLYGEVGPVLAHARRALLDYLQPRVPRPQTTAAELLANVPSIAVERRAAARAIALATTASARQAAVDAYLRRFGDESGGWDVIEPTFGEDPTRLLLLGGATREGAQHRAPAGEPSPAAGEPPLAADDEARFRVVVDRARAAVAVGEDDDALFARLQAAVRRALLRLGGKLVTQGSLDEPAHVFFLPLVLSASLDDAPTAPELRAIVATNREAWTAARRSPPTPARPDAPADIIRIRGLPGGAGRAIGHAVHHPSSAPLASDSILIASTLLPTELPLLFPAAVVVETGGILGHVAAQARERNLPAVVSAPGARTIREGSLILVDGDRGEVVVLEA